MKPLNKAERITLFLKFLSFFVITVALIVAAIFIDFQIPHVENKLLKQRYEQINKELVFQTAFSKKMHEVKLILDSINNSGQNIMYLEQLASTKLAGMKESIPDNDSLSQKALYDYIIQDLITIQYGKRDLRNFKESQSAIKAYETSLDGLKNELDQAKRDLDICRQLTK
jgi:hypothetical protein